MRTAVHLSMILLIGVGLGLAIRSFRAEPRPAGPGPGDVVYTNDPLTTAEPIENPDPTRPPEDEEWLSRFELTERSGATVRSEQLLGQPYIVSFFFSTCPSICVKQNLKLKELQDTFAGQGIKLVAITVDPETDTPEKLREYAARFGADPQQWLFMTGDLTYIRRVAAEVFQQHADKQVHSERFVLVDPEGKIEGFYNWSEPKQFAQLIAKIRTMISGSQS